MSEAMFLAGLDGQRFTARKADNEMKSQRRAFDFISQRIIESGLTQAEIAIKAEVSPSTLKAIKKGSSESLRLTTAISIMRTLGIDWVEISQASEAILKPKTQVKIDHLRKKRMKPCKIYEIEIETELIFSFIHEIVREKALRKGLALVDIASRAGIDQSYLGMIMNRKRLGSLYTFFRLLTALDSDLYELDRFKARSMRVIHTAL